VHGIVLPIVLLTNGLSAGVSVGTQLGILTFLARLPADRYVRAHAFLSTRYDPFMPACLTVAALGDGVTGAMAGQLASRVLCALAGSFLLCTMAISLMKNVPTNRWVRTLDPDSLPANFAERDPRRSWARWNRVRTTLTVTALLLNCLAVGLLLRIGANVSG
jgi:uncharacterized membrane protein